MASSLLVTYLGSGLLASRPAAPSVPTGGMALFYGTDTLQLYAYDTSWHTVDSAPVASVFGRTGTIAAVAGDYTADEVDYDNAGSGLTATDVQAAIDEVAAAAGGAVASVFGRTGTVVAVAGDYDADEITYDNAGSGLVATNVQAAIDEVAVSTGGNAFSPPLAATFSTIVNNTGSTGSAVNDDDRGLLLTLVSTAGTISYTQFLKAYTIPGAGTDTFIWGARYTPTSSSSTNTCAGMVLADAATTGSDRLFFGFNLGPASPIDVFVRQATGNTTVAGGATTSFDLNDSKRWFKLEVDSTGAIRFYNSADGAIWHLFQSTTVATFLGAVSYIGFILGGITDVTGNMSVFYYEES